MYCSYLNMTNKVIPQSVEFLYMIDIFVYLLLFVTYSMVCIKGLCEHVPCTSSESSAQA